MLGMVYGDMVMCVCVCRGGDKVVEGSKVGKSELRMGGRVVL